MAINAKSSLFQIQSIYLKIVLQPFSQFTGGLFVTDSNDRSMYHGVEAIFKRRMNKGLSFQLAYTWAVSKDSRSFDPVFTTVATGTSQTAANTPFDNLNQDLNYSWSDFDRRHRFASADDARPRP